MGLLYNVRCVSYANIVLASNTRTTPVQADRDFSLGAHGQRWGRARELRAIAIAIRYDSGAHRGHSRTYCKENEVFLLLLEPNL